MYKNIFLFSFFVVFAVSCTSLKVKDENDSLLSFSPNEKALIDSAENSILSVMQDSELAQNAVLRKESIDLNPTDKYSVTLENIMRKTLEKEGGVGIASPQIGINRKLVIVQRFDKETKPFEAYYNISIDSYSKELQEGWEGCLSIEGGFGKVKRSQEIAITYQNSKGEKHTEKISGFTAVIFQHETDHLNGILFIDKMSSEKLVPEEEYRRMKKQSSDKN